MDARQNTGVDDDEDGVSVFEAGEWEEVRDDEVEEVRYSRNVVVWMTKGMTRVSEDEEAIGWV